jgi:hypothetical protein
MDPVKKLAIGAVLRVAIMPIRPHYARRGTAPESVARALSYRGGNGACLVDGQLACPEVHSNEGAIPRLCRIRSSGVAHAQRRRWLVRDWLCSP